MGLYLFLSSLFEAHLYLKVKLFAPKNGFLLGTYRAHAQVEVRLELSSEVDDFTQVDFFIRLADVEDP